MSATHCSFDELIEHHRPELLAYLRRLLGNIHDAEDVCQDAFLRAYRAVDRLEANSNLRAWLYKVATNTALTFLRRRKRASSRAVDMELETIEDASANSWRRTELQHRIVRAVSVLPPKQRAALMQRQFEGLSYEEIGEALGCTAESARANVYQAIKKLRAALRDV